MAGNVEMMNVLLIHNLPTPYRTEFFNRLSTLMSERSMHFHVIFQGSATKRRSYWKNPSEGCDFSFQFSKSITIGGYSHKLRIPWNPIHEFSKNAPDVIVATGFNLYTIFAFFYTRIKNIPLMIWTGEREIKGLGKNLRILVRKWLLKHTRCILAYGKAAQDFYVHNFDFPTEKMITLLNVIPVRHEIDVPVKIQSKKEELEKRILRLIFVGDLKISKGIYYIPDFLRELVLTLPQHAIELIIIGGGPEEKVFKNSLKLYKDRVVIHFLGKIPNRQVLHEIAGSHFLLFPTLGEPWGHVITEAFSVGTPVFTSRFAGAVPDMLTEGENGFVVDFGYPNQIANTIHAMISNIPKYEKMCKFAKQSYHDIFNSLDNAKTMVDVIIKELQDA